MFDPMDPRFHEARLVQPDQSVFSGFCPTFQPPKPVLPKTPADPPDPPRFPDFARRSSDRSPFPGQGPLFHRIEAR